jgi:hypothetical protein
MDQLEVTEKSLAEEISQSSSILTPYGVGETLSYKGEDDVTVMKVYLDDGHIPFYDIRFRDGREKQTTHEYLREFQQESAPRNSSKSTKNPGLWKLAGRSIRKGIASTNKSFNRGFSALQEIVSLPKGQLKLDLGELKVYKPLDKIKGVIKINLNEAMTAQQLTVTLRAARPIRSDEKTFFDDEWIFDEEYIICEKQIYEPNGEIMFEILVPRLGTKQKNDSIISSLVQEFKDLRFNGNASWTMFCSLKMPGESLRTMYSDTYRIHVDDS